DPQRALAVAEHALDLVVADPDVERLPRAVSRRELDRRAVADDEPMGIGPQAADLHRRPAWPAGRGLQPALAVLHVQPGAVGSAPELARDRRQRVDRPLRDPARAAARESRTVPARDAIGIPCTRCTVGSDADHEVEARAEAVFAREVRESF